MRKLTIALLALSVLGFMIVPIYADEAVDAAKLKLKESTSAYVAAKKELSDAQIKSGLTVGKSEKQDAVARIKQAKKEVIETKKKYQAALHELKKCEMVKDKGIDRTPWR